MFGTSIRNGWSFALAVALVGCATSTPRNGEAFSAYVPEAPDAGPPMEAPAPPAPPPPVTPPVDPPDEPPPVDTCQPDAHGTLCRAIAEQESLSDEPLTIRLATGDEITLADMQSIDAAMELCDALNEQDDYCVLERCRDVVEPPPENPLCGDGQDGMSDWHLCEAVLTGEFGGPAEPPPAVLECPPLTFPFVGAVTCYVTWLVTNAVDLASNALTVSFDFLLSAFGDAYPVFYGLITNPLVVGILDPIVTPLLGGFISLQDLVLLLPPPGLLPSC